MQTWQVGSREHAGYETTGSMAWRRPAGRRHQTAHGNITSRIRRKEGVLRPTSGESEPRLEKTTGLPRAGWVSMLLLEWLRKQCNHPAQRRTRWSTARSSRRTLGRRRARDRCRSSSLCTLTHIAVIGIPPLIIRAQILLRARTCVILKPVPGAHTREPRSLYSCLHSGGVNDGRGKTRSFTPSWLRRAMVSCAKARPAAIVNDDRSALTQGHHK